MTRAVTASRALPSDGLLRNRAVRCAAAAISAVLFTVWLLTNLGGTTVTTWIDDIGELVAAAGGAAACALAARRTIGRDRMAWALISASCGMWATGQLIWSWFELITHTNPFPSLADAGFAAAIPLMIAGLLSFPRLLRGKAVRLLAGVDALIIAVGLLVVSWATALGAVYSSGAGSAWTLALSLLYPASDIAIITLVLVLATRARSTMRAPLLLLAAGIAAIAISDSSLAYATSINAGMTVSLDGGWFAGFLLISLAGLEATDPGRPVSSRTPMPAVLRSAFLYLVVAAAMAIVAWHVRRGESLDVVLFVSLVALILLTVSRQLLAIQDSAGILRRLVHDSLTGLPDRATLCSRIDQALASGSGKGMVLCIDVDNFAAINARFGRKTGDLVLEVIGHRLDAAIERPNVVAHLGADRFAVLLVGVTDVDAAIEVAKRTQQSVETQVAVRGNTVLPVTTVGISPVDGADTGRDVIAGAEAAVLAGKMGGKHALAVFEPLLEDAASRI